MKLEDRDRLQDILEHVHEAAEFVGNRSEAEFLSDRMRVLAVTRLVEIIGEAANNLSTDLMMEQPQIPWSDIIGMRQFQENNRGKVFRIVHHYHGVSVRSVYRTVKEDLPFLIATVNKLLSLP